LSNKIHSGNVKYIIDYKVKFLRYTRTYSLSGRGRGVRVMILRIFRIHCMISFRFVSQFTDFVSFRRVSFRFVVFRFVSLCFVSVSFLTLQGPVPSHWQTLSHNFASSTLAMSGIQTDNFSGDRHHYHTITTVTANIFVYEISAIFYIVRRLSIFCCLKYLLIPTLSWFYEIVLWIVSINTASLMHNLYRSVSLRAIVV